MSNENVLLVKTLGGFSMSWNGRSIGGGNKSRNSQTTRLLQIIIHNRKTGVERSKLEELLFEESNSDDLRHMFRSIVYNTKKKLQEAGLPGNEMIVYKNGRYYWTDSIPVREDAEEFEKMCERAFAEEDKMARAIMLRDACLSYDGEFLPDQTGLPWVIREDRRYRELFCDCMDEAVIALRELRDYRTIEDLGRHATAINPLAEWEFVTMEALIAMEKYDEARALYEKTENYYMRELGTKPSADSVGLLDKLGGAIGYKFSMIDEIQSDLSGSSDRVKGGYVCTYPVFRGIYQLVERLIDRSGQSAYLMLCTLVDNYGQPMRDGAVLTRLTEKLGEIICVSVRNSDIVCRYGKGQFIVLLMNTTAENCSIAAARISKKFRAESQRNRVEYHVSVVTYDPFFD